VKTQSVLYIIEGNLFFDANAFDEIPMAVALANLRYINALNNSNNNNNNVVIFKWQTQLCSICVTLVLDMRVCVCVCLMLSCTGVLSPTRPRPTLTSSGTHCVVRYLHSR